jgi:predicted PurR-regulated permease PerM
MSLNERGGLTAKALTIALIASIILLLFPYASGLLGGAILYVVAHPVVQRLERSGTRRVAAFVAVIVIFVVLVVPGVWLLLELLGEVPDAVRSLQQSAAVQRIMTVRLGGLDLGSHLQQATADIFRWSSQQTLGALGGLLKAAINLVIALFGTYYLLIQGDAIWDRLQHLLPFPESTSDRLRARFHAITEAMLLGVGLTAIAQGTLVGVALALAGFDHALFWGSVTAAVSILPMFGSAVVWVPAALILAAQGRGGAAILLASFGTLIVSNVDNVLRLVVYRRVSHIHPMVTLVGAFAGVNAFGLAGLLLGPLMLCYAIELARIRVASNASAAPVAGQAFPLTPSGLSPTPATAANS